MIVMGKSLAIIKCALIIVSIVSFAYLNIDLPGLQRPYTGPVLIGLAVVLISICLWLEIRLELREDVGSSKQQVEVREARLSHQIGLVILYFIVAVPVVMGLILRHVETILFGVGVMIPSTLLITAKTRREQRRKRKQNIS